MSNDVIYSPEELRVSTEQTRPTESVTKREYELIQELIKLRKDKNIDLEYEDLDDYEVPPRTQFSMLKKPAVTINHSTLTFNAAAIRMFEGLKYGIPILLSGRERKRMYGSARPSHPRNSSMALCKRWVGISPADTRRWATLSTRLKVLSFDLTLTKRSCSRSSLKSIWIP